MSDTPILLSMDLPTEEIIDAIWEKMVDKYRLSLLEGLYAFPLESPLLWLWVINLVPFIPVF